MATILYVDPQEAVQPAIQAALGHNNNLLIASDGPTAVQYCAMLQPDLVIINASPVDFAGADLITRLKMFMPRTLIVAIAPPAETAESLRADMIIPEPVNPADLKQHVQQVLAGLDAAAGGAPASAEAQIAALNRANRRLASLNAVSALIGTSLDLEHLTDEILAQIHKTVDFDSATLLLLKGHVLQAAASRGFSDYRRGMNTYTKNDRNSAWRVVENKLPLIIHDVTTSRYWEPRPELDKVRSWLGVPMIYKDRVVGVLTLDKNQPHAFSDADARYVFTLAFQIAIAVENAQLFEEWEDQAARLKLINEVAQEINTILDVDHLFSALGKAIYDRLHYDWVSVWEVDETRAVITLNTAHGHPPQERVQQPVDAGIIGHTVQTGQPRIIHNQTQRDLPLLVDGLDPQSLLIVPLVVGTQVEAVICAARRAANGFTDHDLWTLSSLGSQAAIAVKNAWLYRGLDTYSDTLERAIAARTQRLHAIKRISQIVSQGLDMDELLTVVRSDIGLIFGPAKSGPIPVNIGLLNGSTIVLNRAGAFKLVQATVSEQLIAQAKPKIFRNVPVEDVFCAAVPANLELIATLMMAPLISGGKTLGFISVQSEVAYAFDDSDLETLETLAFQIASAIEHARLIQKTKDIAIVEERTRLARDMHDGVAQNLAYLLIQVDRSLNIVEAGSKLEAQLEKIGLLLKQNIEELRRNIFDLRPIALEGKSLFEVLENFVAEFGQRWAIKTTCVTQGDNAQVSPEVERIIYRIVQEALSNARQHAHCTEILVQLTITAKPAVTLEVRDNGRGFDPTHLEPGHNRRAGRGLGLTSMRERAQKIGGSLWVDSAPGDGTYIRAVLPV